MILYFLVASIYSELSFPLFLKSYSKNPPTSKLRVSGSNILISKLLAPTEYFSLLPSFPSTLTKSFQLLSAPS